MDITAIRRGIPALNRTVYLNTGTYGPLPAAVADEIIRWYSLIEAEGSYAFPVTEALYAAYEKTREKVAALLGAEPDEIALTRNVSDGINIVAHGLGWRPGDEVIISDQEHESGRLAWYNLARQVGLTVRVLPLVNDGEAILARLEELISPRTRLIFLSHVSCLTGLRLPVAAICHLAQGRGMPVMFDGAHAVGQFPVNVQALGCDFYASCGHKWLLGPQGTGFLYVRRERLSEVDVSWAGWGSRSEENEFEENWEWQEGTRRFEFGTRHWALYAALGTAIEAIQALGPAAIEAHVRELTAPLKRSLEAMPGVTLLTPHDPRLSAGLVAFQTKGFATAELGRQLWEERRILTSHDPQRSWLRLSVAFFTLREELDMVVEVLQGLAPHSVQPAAEAATRAE